MLWWSLAWFPYFYSDLMLWGLTIWDNESVNFIEKSDFRAISKDETLWQKINLHGKCVPAEFLEMVLQNGCKYLKLSNIKVEGNLNLKGVKCKLKYLHMEETGLFAHKDVETLLQSCHSLQKLQMFGINQKMVESICLQVSILGVESLLPFSAWLFSGCKKRTYLPYTY